MRILVCGMPRSMTTWAFNAIRELVAAPRPRSMWIEPGAKEEGEFAAASGVVVAKCHHFSPALARSADVVVYSYRDLRTAAVSALRKFGSTGSREQLDVWVHAERMWRRSAHLVLRYEDVERDPAAATGALRELLRSRCGAALALSAEPDAAILARVEETFRSNERSTRGTHDEATLIQPGHRTFQPSASALPADEKALYDRVGEQFHGWLAEHGYLGAGVASLPPLADDEAEFAEYVAALMRESASKEATVTELSAAIEEARRSKQAAIMEITRSLEAKQKVLEELKRAVDSYRATFAFTRFIVGPVNFVVLSVRGLWRRIFRRIGPRLGNLSQHPPRPLILPREYSVPPPLAAQPRICIVTPSFRQCAYIERTIRSVLDQSYANLEHVVQDGASEDGTREILERYADRLSSWESRPDSGQTQAINRGFARTRGEIMAWLNSDDILLPGALHYVADFFQGHPDVDVVYGHRILIDENDQQIGRWLMPPHNDDVLSWADFVPQETLFFRRSIWEKAGGRVDESFRFAMDWDLLVRFREAGARFACLPRFIGGFRVHPQQKTSAAIGDIGFEEMDRIRQRVLGRVPTDVEVRKAVAPYLMRHVATDWRWAIRNKLGMSA